MVIQIERLYSHLRQSVSFSYYEQDFNLHVNNKIWGTWRYTCICIAALKLQFLLGVRMDRRETENNAYAKFWGDKQSALWYVMVFSELVNRAFSLTRPASV